MFLDDEIIKFSPVNARDNDRDRIGLVRLGNAT